MHSVDVFKDLLSAAGSAKMFPLLCMQKGRELYLKTVLKNMVLAVNINCQFKTRSSLIVNQPNV